MESSVLISEQDFIFEMVAKRPKIKIIINTKQRKCSTVPTNATNFSKTRLYLTRKRNKMANPAVGNFQEALCTH